MEKWLKKEVGRTRYSIGTASMGVAGSAELGRGRRDNQDEVKKTGEGSREEGKMEGKMSMGSNRAWDRGQRWPNHEEKQRFHVFLAGKTFSMGGQKIEGKAEAKESPARTNTARVNWEKSRTGGKSVLVHMLPGREESIRWGWQCA